MVVTPRRLTLRWFDIFAVSMIRPYASGDLDEVLDVWYRASLIAHSFLTEDFFESERLLIAEHWLPMADVFVYETAGSVIGFLALVGNEVGAIFVLPAHQGRGVGRSLMDQARRSRPFLELDVFEANALGRRFYDAYGFRLVERTLDEATGQPTLRLRLDYPPPPSSATDPTPT
jgi:putative acetyltransferase